MRNTKIMLLVAGLAIVTVSANLFAEEDCPLAGLLADGTPTLDVRLRYEHGDLEGSDASEAFTLRTRLGYQTRDWHGLQAFVEFENVSALNAEDAYNQAGLNGASNRTVIADVEGTELNQAYLQGSCAMSKTRIRAGLQRIILDNARFIGNVGWRQNEQTYEAATLQNTFLENLTVFYGYLSGVNRIFGQENGTEPYGEAGNTAAFDSAAHLVNVAYKPCEVATVIAYGYLLDLGDGTTAAALSSDTYGARLVAGHEAECGVKSSLELEVASQSENSASPDGMDYTAHYIKAGLVETFGRYSLGAGYELLGSDDGMSFKTPLATGHKFNGWADLFLVTPAAGLEDIYLSATADCPSGYSATVLYHFFSSDEDSIDYGGELDVVLKKKLCKNVTLVAKYAGYRASSDTDNPRPNDIDRVSAQFDILF